ncbi:lysylphosphatidylglycerol synthase domain-containing protein [Phytoactinopolyspora halotolerans]|uniref:Flippase-like domain-containing protein n=1 Tax=Phytoactinopolyspora halotolerans TaxID=1981512 RepID=A0A6L9S9I6_9ACTN|nr:lysylphosphatidylglycerol synthase domain-containing protein [Phytoactinopolyspora halotolerans]NEE01222.1 flippase-like domain-containing protein [Phytoactinopolyspora halotolerans]
MRSVTRWVGLIVAVAGVVFVVRELVNSWDDVRDAIGDADPALIAAAPVVGAGGMLLIGLGWRRCLAILGARRRYVDTLYRYYVGQLGKYVPGGIWPVVGRGEMARRGGVAGSVAYGSTVLSIGVTYLAAILIVVLALVAGAAGGDGVAWRPVAALLPVGILALHPRVVAAVLRLLRRVSGRDLGIPVPSWGVSMGLVGLHAPAWLAIGGATWMVALAIDPSEPELLNLLFATVLSWVVGLLVVPAPGGVGVREAVFVAAATSLSSAGVAAAVAVTARVVFIVVDLASAGIATLVARRLGRDAERTP